MDNEQILRAIRREAWVWDERNLENVIIRS